MINFKSLAGLIALMMTLTACSSSPSYRAATDGGFGYAQSKLTEQQYRVSFKARGSDSEKAMDYALLRAAEITLEQGYDWFIVSHRETFVDRQASKPNAELGYRSSSDVVTRCGLVSCSTRRYPAAEYAAGIYLGGSARSEVISIIEVQLGKGVRPEVAYTFSAAEVVANLAAVE